MKKKISFLILGFATLLISSCSNTPKDACDCIKRTANTFMLQGVEIQSIEDLRRPCADIIDQFQEDASGRAIIYDCGDEVLKALKKKTLLEIDGEDVGDFESFQFNTVSEYEKFIKENVNTKKDRYRYANCKVTIREAYILTLNKGESLCSMDGGIIEEIFAFSSQKYNDRRSMVFAAFKLHFEDKSLIKQIIPSLNFENSNIIDLNLGVSIPSFTSKSYGDFKTSYIGSILEASNQGLQDDKFGLESWIYSSILNGLEKIEGECGNQQFRKDAKSGRYLATFGNNDYYKKKYGYYYSLCKGEISGRMNFFYSKLNPSIDVEKMNLKKLAVPKELKGKSYDFDKILGSVIESSGFTIDELESIR